MGATNSIFISTKNKQLIIKTLRIVRKTNKEKQKHYYRQQHTEL